MNLHSNVFVYQLQGLCSSALISVADGVRLTDSQRGDADGKQATHLSSDTGRQFQGKLFFFPSIFFWPLFGFIDRTAEDMTGNRMREREGEWGRGTQLAFYDDCQQKLICVLSVRLFAVCINYKLTSCCIEEDLKLNNWDHKLTRKLFTEVTDQARSRITFPLLAIRKNAGVRLFWIGFIFFFFCFSDCKQSVLCTRR